MMDKGWWGMSRGWLHRWEKKTAQWKLGRWATAREGQMRTVTLILGERRLESFQPVFPALVVMVWCHHCLIELFIHSTDKGEGDNGAPTELTTFPFHPSLTISQSSTPTFLLVGHEIGLCFSCQTSLSGFSNPSNVGCLYTFSCYLFSRCLPHTPAPQSHLCRAAQIAKIKLLISYSSAVTVQPLLD